MPDAPAVHYQLGLLYRRLGQTDPNSICDFPNNPDTDAFQNERDARGPSNMKTR